MFLKDEIVYISINHLKKTTDAYATGYIINSEEACNSEDTSFWHDQNQHQYPLEGIMLSQMSKTEKEKYMISLLYESKTQNKEKNKQTLRYWEQTDDCQMEEGLRGWVKKGEGINMYKLAVTK